MPEKTLGVVGSYFFQGLSDGFVELFLCSGFGATQAAFDFGPHQFDGIEIGAIGRLVPQLDMGLLE